MKAYELFMEGMHELQQGNNEIAQRIFGESLPKFEKEFEGEKHNAEFHYHWATALRTAGNQVHNIACIEQVSLLRMVLITLIKIATSTLGPTSDIARD
jgi:hypothetical protein